MAITNNSAKEVNQFLTRHTFSFYHNCASYIKALGLWSKPKTIIVNKKGIVVQVLDCLDSVVDYQKKALIISNGDELIREIKKVL